jgi:hypothetical protein
VLSIRRWRASHLFGSWIAYWILLFAFAAGRPLLRIWQLSRSNTHGSAGISYSGSALAAALWIAGPPLLLFVLWLATRTRAPRQPHPDDAVGERSVTRR